MHDKKLLGVFFSIILLSGITGVFSPIAVDAASKSETIFTHFKTPTMIVDNGYQIVDAGDDVVFTGYLWKKIGANGLEPLVGRAVQIVDKNEYKTSQKNYIPLIGNGVTDNSGKFSISWNAIKHTGFVQGDGSFWTPVVHFYGDSKYNPSEKMGNQFWVKDYPKVQPILDSDNDGILDNVDSCISEAETFNNYFDSDGCPDTKPEFDTTLTSKLESVIGIDHNPVGEAIEGQRITIMGKLTQVTSRESETNFSGYSIQNEKVVLRNAQGEIIGSDYTDKYGKFQIPIHLDFDESIHFITTDDYDGRKIFKMSVTLEYEGNSKGSPATLEYPRIVYLKDENYNPNDHPIMTWSDDGTLSVNRNEFVGSQQNAIKINGHAYWADGIGDKVNLYVLNPNNIIQEHTVTVTSDNEFSLSIPLNSYSPLGWYEVGGFYVQEDNWYDPEQYFKPISFKVVDKITIPDYTTKTIPVEISHVTTPKQIQEKSEFIAFADDSDGDSLSLSQHTLDVAGDADDRHLEIVVGVKDWKESQTEPRIQIYGFLPEGKTAIYLLTVLKKTQGYNGITYFTGEIDVKRGERLATFEVHVKWPTYSDGTLVRESPPVQTYKVIDSNAGYIENQSYKDKAYREQLEYENKIELYATGIKTAEQSLAGLQYESPQAQKKIDDAWDVRWQAITKLDSITINFELANNNIEDEKFKDASLKFDSIGKTSSQIEDDLKWISTAISDAKKLEEEHKSFGFLDSAFSSEEGTNCIWFICW